MTRTRMLPHLKPAIAATKDHKYHHYYSCPKTNKQTSTQKFKSWLIIKKLAEKVETSNADASITRLLKCKTHGAAQKPRFWNFIQEHVKNVFTTMKWHICLTEIVTYVDTHDCDIESGGSYKSPWLSGQNTRSLDTLGGLSQKSKLSNLTTSLYSVDRAKRFTRGILSKPEF